MMAVANIMFRKNVTFQLAIVLLAMFAAYTVQVRNAPFMSLSERPAVLEDHQYQITKGSIMHVKLEARLVQARGQSRKKATRATLVKDVAVETASYIYNYNTVEATLQACAVFVCLAGIMFASGQYKDSFYATQQLVLTYTVIVVLLASTLYVVSVLLYDVIVTVSPNAFDGMIKMCRTKEAQREHDMKEAAKKTRPGDKSEAAGDVIAFAQNPLLVQGKRQLAPGEIPDDVPEQSLWDQIRVDYGRLEGTLLALEEDSSVVAAGRGAAAGGRGGAAAAARPPVNSFSQRVDGAAAAPSGAAEAKPTAGKAGKAGKAAGPTSLVARPKHFTEPVVGEGVDNALVPGGHAAAPAAAAAAAEVHESSLMDRARRALSIPVADASDDTAGLMAMMAGHEVPRSEWYRRWDAESGVEYFVSAMTAESAWVLPEGAVLVDEAGAVEGGGGGGGVAAVISADIWVQRYDEGSGVHYFVNVSSQETTWDRPESGRIITEEEYVRLATQG